MVKCKICGLEKEYSIKDHIKWVHGLNKISYLEKYPNSEITSNKQKQLISDRAKKMWGDNQFKEKMCINRSISHNKPEYKSKMSTITKDNYIKHPEYFKNFINWSKTDEFKEWVVSEERIDKIRKSSLERWGDDDYRLKVINSITQKLKDGRCKKDDDFKEKMSKIISEKYAKGELTNNCGKYKTGWYVAKNSEKYFFSSSYEEMAMKLFDDDENVISWTNKHGIIIPYIKNGFNKRYVPDFMVNMKNGYKLIIETKGWLTDEVLLKETAAKKLYNYYKVCYNINEVKEYLNEFK